MGNALTVTFNGFTGSFTLNATKNVAYGIGAGTNMLNYQSTSGALSVLELSTGMFSFSAASAYTGTIVLPFNCATAGTDGTISAVQTSATVAGSVTVTWLTYTGTPQPVVSGAQFTISN